MTNYTFEFLKFAKHTFLWLIIVFNFEHFQN